MIKFKFNKLHVFDGDNIEGLIDLSDNKTYQVVDWINVRSGMSYSGAFNLSELREQATFIRQTGSGFRESKPHILL